MEWDVPISVFGVTVRPGQLIHADQHGFLVVPEEDEAKLEEATSFMDRHLFTTKSLYYHIIHGRESAHILNPHIDVVSFLSMNSLERQQVLVPGRRAMATGVHPSITAARMQQVSLTCDQVLSLTQFSLISNSFLTLMTTAHMQQVSLTR